MSRQAKRKALVIERWENVIRVLRALTPHERRKHWDMSDWGRKTDCGTIGCAAGHCGMDPWFTRRGFKLVFTPGGYGHMSKDPEQFFDSWGVDHIFHDSTKRPVGVVIKEIQQHIKNIKLDLVDIDSHYYG